MGEDLTTLDRRITDALAALRSARAVAEHSLNSTTRWRQDRAERVLNALLDQRSRAQLREHADILAGTAVGSRSTS
jgi:hypothetical protein